MSENAVQMLNRIGTDAVAWGAELKKLGVVDCDVQEGSQFHGWLCNIIMVAYDRGALDAGGTPKCSPYWLTPQTRGCSVCGIGADGQPMGYACPRNDCPTRAT